MTAFPPIFATTLIKSLQNAAPLAGGIAAGLLAGYLLARYLDRKSGRHKKKQTRRR